MGKYFGTDGVRGVANSKLTPELVFRLGRSGGYVLTRSKQGKRPKIVIGRDTRISGEMLEAALIAGLLSIGVDVVRLGIIPTPGVAYLTKTRGADAGVMISASHNPVEDNGIKFFGGDGFKLSDEMEAEIEALLDSDEDRIPRPIGGDVGRVQDDLEGGQAYISYLKSTVKNRFEGLKVVLDCANGAASMIAPQLFRDLGADTVVLAHQPDGLNINKDCGSTHPEAVQQAVLEHQANLGLSFDGDADRLIAVDEKGTIVDGDHILFILAGFMKKQHRLNNNTVVSTVMSNLGFYKALEKNGVGAKQTKVGDRYVLEEMVQGGYNLGGEQSGHIVMLDYNTTGDGMLCAIQLMDVLMSESESLSGLAECMTKYPQLLVNVQVEDKSMLAGNQKIEEAIKSVEHKMGGNGRVLVRPSGTESIVRVMAEGPNEQELSSFVGLIVDVVKEELAYNLV
ncbi:phosphoglucosamine mutase [Paenibacillus sp. 1011MAR3C5]|uniref:phosphoglucosamine mutase n=1 Tax=Paenibacillus sp. 1011MAR3C5 TaxID=1675787 RepID=UPI000E6BC80C|nr:phosphoglucosamine mutase [Paenibacillus sp. 1011MAR3C5]RJE84713.1 phosphoglucosamine mutase [Paenibacillus sp. 1011MAR3C5]